METPHKLKKIWSPWYAWDILCSNILWNIWVERCKVVIGGSQLSLHSILISSWLDTIIASMVLQLRFKSLLMGEVLRLVERVELVCVGSLPLPNCIGGLSEGAGPSFTYTWNLHVTWWFFYQKNRVRYDPIQLLNSVHLQKEETLIHAGLCSLEVSTQSINWISLWPLWNILVKAVRFIGDTSNVLLWISFRSVHPPKT